MCFVLFVIIDCYQRIRRKHVARSTATSVEGSFDSLEIACYGGAVSINAKPCLFIVGIHPTFFCLTRIPTSLKLRNPFSENIMVTAVDLELYPCEDQILGACNLYYTY